LPNDVGRSTKTIVTKKYCNINLKCQKMGADDADGREPGERGFRKSEMANFQCAQLERPQARKVKRCRKKSWKLQFQLIE